MRPPSLQHHYNIYILFCDIYSYIARIFVTHYELKFFALKE